MTDDGPALTVATQAPGLEHNPLREWLVLPRSPDPNVMVIFGASGDLTARKLMPALYNLALNRYLPSGFSIVGAAITPWSEEEFRKAMLDAVTKFSRTQPVDRAVWDSFAEGLFYVPLSFDDQDAYQRLKAHLEKIDTERGTNGNRVFYMATLPEFFPVIIRQIGQARLGEIGGSTRWSRVILEKPFGHDLKSARELNDVVHEVFREPQVYRIDHYLGKETVQNTFVFRFANGIFEPIWNRRYVDHVQITVAEDIGIERRGAYYEHAGALRDIVQNHLLQLLSITAMEPPANFDAEIVRDEKVKVLRSIRPLLEEDMVRGQYGPGWVAGLEVKGYREEDHVAPDSMVETYVAMRLYVDNWRWAETPFYLRTGKRLPSRASEIAIQFKNAPHLPFQKTAVAGLSPNVLVMRIQPHEGTSLKIAAKIPGPAMRMRTVNMDFFYGSSFLVESPDAYERLVLDCMLGDPTLFAREDEVERAWGLVDRIETIWAGQPPPKVPNYAAGTWGPEEADALIEREGRRWRRP